MIQTTAGGRERGGNPDPAPLLGSSLDPKIPKHVSKVYDPDHRVGGGEPRTWTPDLGKSSSGDPGPPKIPKHVSKVYDPDHRGGEPRPWTPDPGKSSSGVPGPPWGELQAKTHQSWSLDSFGESPGLSKTPIFGPGPPAGGSSDPQKQETGALASKTTEIINNP